MIGLNNALMRLKFLLTATLLLSSCVSPAPEGTPWARKWVTTDEGYIYSVGYFTPAQLRSQEWETKRFTASRSFQGCGDEKVIHRDVRWFESSAPGHRQCAQVIYSVMCPSADPNAVGALEYERQQELLEEPPEPIPSGCTIPDKPKHSVKSTPLPLALPEHQIEPARCDLDNDGQRGIFHLDRVNFVNEKSLVFPALSRPRGGPRKGDAIFFVRFLAGKERKIHLVMVNRTLHNDGRNLFAVKEQSIDGGNSCISLQCGKATLSGAKQSSARSRATSAAAGPTLIKVGWTGRYCKSSLPANWVLRCQKRWLILFGHSTGLPRDPSRSIKFVADVRSRRRAGDAPL